MISIVLATYNEEKNIERCLEAIKDIANEIIVVDGSSSDASRELAKKFGAKVIKTTNKPNFHINKQMAMDHAKGDLVLQLDADEVVDNDLKNFIVSLNHKIEGMKKTKDWIKSWKIKNPVAWEIPRKNLFLGKWLEKGGQYPDPVIRLYINGQAKLPQKDVHEQMVVAGEVGWSQGHLLHYANPRFSDYLRKFITYTSFKSNQLMESNLEISIINSIRYIILMPLKTFLQLFLRHRGYVDGVPGFVFALMSGLHHSVAYLMYWELSESRND